MLKQVSLTLIGVSLLSHSSLSWTAPAGAVDADNAKGLWLTAEKDAVIEFDTCPERPASLCGRIVWDIDAGTPADTCGVQIAQLNSYANDAWRDGWVYDPRDKKNYKATIRVKGETLKIRAFIGVEILGETELLSRTHSLPATPVCKN
ncbi:MAG: DUF2147 domain-containing protein [Candidatus Thiodiazotropha sp.]|jgi:uncharacterized protein (DUF2147 family)